MKRMSTLLACLLTFIVVLPAQADGRGYGSRHSVQHFGGHGYVQSHGHGYGSHYRGSSNHWLAPVLGAAIVGSVIYAASTLAMQHRWWCSSNMHRLSVWRTFAQRRSSTTPMCRLAKCLGSP